MKTVLTKYSRCRENIVEKKKGSSLSLGLFHYTIYLISLTRITFLSISSLSLVAIAFLSISFISLTRIAFLSISSLSLTRIACHLSLRPALDLRPTLVHRQHMILWSLERAILDWPVRSLRNAPVEWKGQRWTPTSDRFALSLRRFCQRLRLRMQVFSCGSGKKSPPW